MTYLFCRERKLPSVCIMKKVPRFDYWPQERFATAFTAPFAKLDFLNFSFMKVSLLQYSFPNQGLYALGAHREVQSILACVQVTSQAWRVNANR